MKIRKSHAAWAVKLWVFASVFLLPFLGGWEIAAWLALGGAFGLLWRALPEEGEEEAPVEPLPFQDQYRDKEIPRRPPASGLPGHAAPPKGEGDSA